MGCSHEETTERVVWQGDEQVIEIVCEECGYKIGELA